MTSGGGGGGGGFEAFGVEPETMNQLEEVATARGMGRVPSESHRSDASHAGASYGGLDMDGLVEAAEAQGLLSSDSESHSE